MTVGNDRFHQTFLAEFAEVILWLGHTVTECNEDVPGMERNSLLLVSEIVEKTNDGASGLKAALCTILADNDWRQVPGVRISQGAGLVVIEAQKQRGIL